jgi:hypothetical protein
MPLPFGFGTLQIGMWNRQAQRLIFKYTHQGDLTCFLSAYFDPKSAQADLGTRWKGDGTFYSLVIGFPIRKHFLRFLQHSQPIFTFFDRGETQPSSFWFPGLEAGSESLRGDCLVLGHRSHWRQWLRRRLFRLLWKKVKYSTKNWKKGPAVCWKPGER